MSEVRKRINGVIMLLYGKRICVGGRDCVAFVKGAADKTVSGLSKSTAF